MEPSTARRVRVIPLQPGLTALDYRADMRLAPGDIVLAPLGPRDILGVVWEAEHAPAREVPEGKLRAIKARLDAPPVEAPLRRLIDWVAGYYLAAPGAVLRMALPSTSALSPATDILGYRARTSSALRAPPPAGEEGLSGGDGGGRAARPTPARARALAAIGDTSGSVAELARAGGVSVGMVRALIAAGAIEKVALPPPPTFAPPDPDHAPPALEPAQAAAAMRLVAAVQAGGFAPVLLEGVTGSGKTEVYFEAVAAALRDGGQALVLLPEIALTAPFLARFAARFGAAPAVWHSGLTSTLRRATWRAVASGEARVIVGARSALFLPFPALRLIIVDEAHEQSFKQEEGVPYHGRDAGVMRGQFEGCPVILATATPALETRAQAEAGRYTHLTLPSRFAGAAMPSVRAIDLKRHPPPRGRWLSPPLVSALTATLAAGQQSLLFLNRRGYAPLTLCRACGERIGCPDCSAWLVEHRLLARLLCHHCGHTVPVPPACPACGSPGTLAACGPGVERIADEAARQFSQARIAVATSDTLGSPQRAAAFVAAMEVREIDIVIGTQLVAKGHHFPELTLVGIVDADLGLAGGDLRAAERTFQQIAQAGGRAGRGAKPGRVLLQTYDPTAPVLRALVSGDAAAFHAAEAAARREAGMPPFGRLAALIVSSTDAARAEATARALGRAAPDGEGVRVLGPAPAPLSMLRGRHRWRLLAHARRSADLQGVVAAWLAAVPVPSNVRVGVDVDPYSFV